METTAHSPTESMNLEKSKSRKKLIKASRARPSMNKDSVCMVVVVNSYTRTAEAGAFALLLT